MVPLPYLSNFWKTLELPLMNPEIILISTWSVNCVIVASNVANQNATFSITDTKLDVSDDTQRTSFKETIILQMLR